MPLNIIPTALIDGILHASLTPLTNTEATLGNTGTPDPIPIIEGQELFAIVKLVINGIITAQSTYIVLQTDLNGDGVWIDVAWLVDIDLRQGVATYVLSGGGRGLMNNAFQQSRQAGQFPASSGSNAAIMGGRARFVGKSLVAAGSSIAAGQTAIIAATITYKLSVPR